MDLGRQLIVGDQIYTRNEVSGLLGRDKRQIAYMERKGYLVRDEKNCSEKRVVYRGRDIVAGVKRLQRSKFDEFYGRYFL